MHILTAREFIDQGTSAYNVLSIAKSQTTFAAKRAVEAVAHEVAALTGETLRVADRNPANDNRPPRRRQRAA